MDKDTKDSIIGLLFIFSMIFLTLAAFRCFGEEIRMFSLLLLSGVALFIVIYVIYKALQ